MSILLNKYVTSVSVAIVLCACGTEVHKIRSYPTLTKSEMSQGIKDRKVGEWVLHTSIDNVNLRVLTELGIYVSETGWDLIPVPTSKESLGKRNKEMTDHFMVVVGLNTEDEEDKVSIRSITGMITFLDDRSVLYPNRINQGVRHDCSSLPFAGNKINEPLPIVYKSEKLPDGRIEQPRYTCFQFEYGHPTDPRRTFEFKLGDLVHANGQMKSLRIFFEPGHVRYTNP